MHRLRVFSLVLLLALTLCVSVSAADPPVTFAGEWETTYGHMELTVQGNAVKGSYQAPGSDANDIQGTVDGLKWTFTYTEPDVSGEGSFTFAKDGQSFAGQWREKGSEQWQPWAGRRPAAATAAAAQDFSGVWKTSYGLMRLIQKDNAVTGCYRYGGQSAVSGEAKSGKLEFTYTESTGDKGSGEFKLSPDGKGFTGTWKTSDGKKGGAWEGTRVKPMAGRAWLVVLEAHWESGLQQPEYSYGDMLRHFFSRVPSVEVRHRYFDGKQDFATWCAELPYLNEPVVFYVSSHGTDKGITVGKEVLSGEFIGSQLRFAPEVKLVHLGACLTMSGNAPVALREACGLNVPVSGFTRIADWAGSAVIDFSYLDLVLSRKMKPGDAVRQIRNNVTFAREKDTPDCAISPAGLKIVE